MCVELLTELLGLDLVGVTELACFLGEEIEGFEAGSLDVRVAGLSDLLFGRVEFKLERGLTGREFRIESGT
jgi:hypothetical protein